MRFLITLLLLLWMAPLHAYTVKSGHPRLWLTPDTLTRLKAEVTANSPHWQGLKDAADRGTDWDVTIPNYALAYQLTGNTVYADRAITLMQQKVSRGMGAITGGQYYDAREVMPAVAIGYDWCYDRLTATQRTQFRAQMEAWADAIWPETNPARAGMWAVNNPRNNYFHSFMACNWLTGLALHGEGSKAQSYIDRCLGKWGTMVKPWLTTGAAGGYLNEGTHYGNDSLASILMYLAAHQTATDEALLTGMASWVRDAFMCQLYLTTPDRTRVWPGGDQAMEASGTLNDYRRFPGYIATSYLDNTTAGYARSWLDAITPGENQWRHTRWEEMLWHRVDRPSIDYRTLPTFYYASGAGLVSTRSGWGTDATMLVAICGRVEESHQDRGANGFMLFRGDWLAAHARLNSQSGLLGETQYNNALLIGGQGQEWETGTPTVLKVEDSPVYTYFSGEAAPAYKPEDAVNPLRSWQRDIVFLKAQAVAIILDTVDAVSAAAQKRLLFQALNDLTFGADAYQTTAGGSTLRGRLLLPAGVTMAKSQAEGSFRLSIDAPTGQSVARFLTVYQAGSSGFTPLAESLVADSGGLVRVQVGTNSVSINALTRTVTVGTEGGLPPPPPPPPPPPTGATTYYVASTGNDAAAGALAAPWRTLQKAANAVAPGDTVVIFGGEYAGFVLEQDGQQDHPITFKASEPGVVLVRGDQTSGQDAIFIDNADWIMLDGISVRNAARAGIRVSLSNHVTIRHCKALSNGKWGIFTDYCDDLVIEENECAGSALEHGIYVSNSGDRPIIRHNVCRDNNWGGIQVNADPALIEPAYGTRGDGIIDGAIIEGNTIYGNGAGGAAGINLASVRNGRVVNNLLYHNLAGGIAGWDDGVGDQWGTKNNLIAHNTVMFRPVEGRWCLSLKNGSTNNSIRNNLLVGGQNGCLEFDNTSPLATDYNLLFSPGNGGVVATNEDLENAIAFAQWRATGNEVSGVGADPLFVATGTDFHLAAGSPAIDAGVNIGSVTTDLQGAARPAGARSDIGCYETAGGIVPPPPPPPPAPAGVQAPSDLRPPPGTGYRVTLYWTQSTSPNIRRNRIYRAADPNGPWVLVANVSARSQWVNSGLMSGRTYYYQITAVDTSGAESLPSNVMEGRTQ